MPTRGRCRPIRGSSTTPASRVFRAATGPSGLANHTCCRSLANQPARCAAPRPLLAATRIVLHRIIGEHRVEGVGHWIGVGGSREGPNRRADENRETGEGAVTNSSRADAALPLLWANRPPVEARAYKLTVQRANRGVREGRQ
jgi:hypothetical protein